MIACQLARLPRYLYASPDYLEVVGEPSQPTDLARHERLRLRTAQSNKWTSLQESEKVEVVVGGRFLLNSVGMIQRLAALFRIAQSVHTYKNILFCIELSLWTLLNCQRKAAEEFYEKLLATPLRLLPYGLKSEACLLREPPVPASLCMLLHGQIDDVRIINTKLITLY